MLATEEELSYHYRLLAGEPDATVAASQLIERYLGKLCGYLKKHHSAADNQLITDMATDALVLYILTPSKYDPTKKSLIGYLYMIAERKLLTAIGRQIKRKQHESAFDFDTDVGYARADVNIYIEDDEATDRLVARELQVQAMALARDQIELKIIQLILDGERDYAAYTTALGLQDLTITQQREEINRVKERVRARLRRNLKDDWSK